MRPQEGSSYMGHQLHCGSSLQVADARHEIQHLPDQCVCLSNHAALLVGSMLIRWNVINRISRLRYDGTTIHACQHTELAIADEDHLSDDNLRRHE
jgi:hypothetical protein